jgi:hypothetical protein
MFGFGKKKKRKSNAANVRLAKKFLGKSPGRRVFGFPCSPSVQAKLKMLAGHLNIPIFILAEHEVEIANLLVEKIIEDTEERELLLEHLKEHIDARSVEKIREVDQDMAENLDAGRIRKLAVYRVVKEIVEHFIKQGIRGEELSNLVYDGLKWRAAYKYYSNSKYTPPKV